MSVRQGMKQGVRAQAPNDPVTRAKPMMPGALLANAQQQAGLAGRPTAWQAAR